MVTLSVFFAYLVSYDRGPLELKADLSTFPLDIGGWYGRQVDLQQAVFRVDGAEHELLRIYQNREGRQIQLYIAYLESQRQGKELVDYRTAMLHEATDELKITIDPQRVISVNRGRFEEQRHEHRILFWYDVNGRVIADRYKAKLATTLDALLRGRTNGALVIIAESPAGRQDEGMQSEEEGFVRELLSVLRMYLP